MSMTTTLPHFDTLVALHANDPAAYEELRRQLLQSCIDGAPERHREALESLLQKIEMVRAAARTPLEAAQGASGLMAESCERLRTALGQLSDANAALQTAVFLSKFRL